MRAVALFSLALLVSGCQSDADTSGTRAPSVPEVSATSDASTYWNSSTIYFLLTDRFYNGEPGNDLALGRRKDAAPLRSFLGGDLQGVLLKLEEGYFDALGIDAIWMTPWVEQVRGTVDEGTGRTYGYHGYWTRDWTSVDPALGTMDDLRAVIGAAHERGIRILMDAVLNHTGPVTPSDSQWPGDWVRTGPRCVYQTYETTVDCTLVANLPDVRTDSDDPVELPGFLREKWEREGRLAREIAELDAFFERTGHVRAPRYYIIKWLTDWVRELGIDGYRVDTSKHFEEAISSELKQEAEQAFADWREAHPDQVLDDQPFFMMGEVYNYALDHGRDFDFGDRSVDFFDHGYDGLINFGFKSDAAGPLDDVFTRYSNMLHDGDLKGLSVVNYVSSHDDGGPFDPEREQPLDTGTRLLLAPGGAQIYYGDELARPLRVDGAEGDANLRSEMNWGDAQSNAEVLEHWRKLGRFRRTHRAVGAGIHRQLQAEPYIFSRTLDTGVSSDRVLVAMDQGMGAKSIPVFGVFAEGTELLDFYSGSTGIVTDGRITLDTGSDLVLLGERD